jgi:hypothetical protein
MGQLTAAATVGVDYWTDCWSALVSVRRWGACVDGVLYVNLVLAAVFAARRLYGDDSIVTSLSDDQRVAFHGPR